MKQDRSKMFSINKKEPSIKKHVCLVSKICREKCIRSQKKKLKWITHEDFVKSPKFREEKFLAEQKLVRSMGRWRRSRAFKRICPIKRGAKSCAFVWANSISRGFLLAPAPSRQREPRHLPDRPLVPIDGLATTNL